MKSYIGIKTLNFKFIPAIFSEFNVQKKKISQKKLLSLKVKSKKQSEKQVKHGEYDRQQKLSHLKMKSFAYLICNFNRLTSVKDKFYCLFFVNTYLFVIRVDAKKQRVR